MDTQQHTPSSPTGFPLQLFIACSLIALNLVTLVGNTLVIMAVILNKHLRSTTNFFIVSLACADLAVGFFVLPFSITNELLKSWIFGKILCRVWMATDVWLCTASIYNLLAITIDRYMAVTKPLSYRFIVSKTRATVIITLVWLVSFLICMPFIIIHWPQGDDEHQQQNQFYRNSSKDHHIAQYPHRQTCTQMNNSPSYILYSALGSFYIPMIVICYFYSRIYCTVRKVASSAQTGLVSMSLVSSPAMLLTEMCATAMMVPHNASSNTVASRAVKKQNSSALRVHRGGYKPMVAKSGLLASPKPDLRKISDSTATGNSYETAPSPKSERFNARNQALMLLGEYVYVILDEKSKETKFHVANKIVLIKYRNKILPLFYSGLSHLKNSNV